MELKPDKKLITKQWLTLFTISLLILIAALILQILIPLKKNVYPEEVSIIVWPIAFGVILLMWLISVPLIILWIKNLHYFIEDDRVTIYKGILTKQQQNIPYRAITDFVLRRSLYDRLFGIGAIRIQTAGQSHNGTGYEGQLSGLVNWEDLHQELRKQLRSINYKTEPTTVGTESSKPLTGDKTDLILEELRAIRKALENK
jgi:uncharacterized membrane protein YdbT with pleckstrin-like domain